MDSKLFNTLIILFFVLIIINFVIGLQQKSGGGSTGSGGCGAGGCHGWTSDC